MVRSTSKSPTSLLQCKLFYLRPQGEQLDVEGHYLSSVSAAQLSLVNPHDSPQEQRIPHSVCQLAGSTQFVAGPPIVQ